MGNFAKTFTNNQAKNINKISDELGKKLETLTTNSSINKNWSDKQVKVTLQQRTNCLYMVALTWVSKLADWWTPPKIQSLILLLIMMILNLKRVIRMTSSRILLTILMQWKEQVHQ